MMMYLPYWGLLVAWVPLLWSAIQLKGAYRLWLLVVIAAGISTLIYETCMYLWPYAAIRRDILLISMALGCLYGCPIIPWGCSRRWSVPADENADDPLAILFFQDGAVIDA